MPKTVEVPDLGVVEFPDDTPDEQISSAISDHLDRNIKKAAMASEMTSLRRQRVLGDIAEGALGGAEAATGVVARMNPVTAISNAADALGIQPIVPPEHIRQIRESVSNLLPRAEIPADAPVIGGTGNPEEDRAIAHGVESSIDEQLSGLTRPDQLALLGAGMKAPIPVARAFQAGTIAALPEAIQNVQQASERGDVGATAKGIAGLTATAAIPALIEHGIPRTEIPALPERAVPVPSPVTPEVTPERAPIPVPKKLSAIPEVPSTPAEPMKGVSVIEEIRNANARTKEAIRTLYPQISREEAAALRKQAWGETATSIAEPKASEVSPEPERLPETRVEPALTPEAPVAEVAPTAKEVPNQGKDWRVSVQSGVTETNAKGETKSIPGYVQIDDLTGGQNVWSKGPEKLRAEGFDVPDFSKLPQGQYTYEQAVKKLAEPAAAPKAEPAKANVPEVKLGVWPESEWSATSLAKQTPIERASKAKFLGLRDKEGQPIAGPKTLADAAAKRIQEIKASAAKPKTVEPAANIDTGEAKQGIPAAKEELAAAKPPEQALPQVGQPLIDVPRGTEPETTKERPSNARKIGSSKTLYGDVRPLEKSAEVMPAKEGERGIQPQTSGGIREPAQPARAEENKVALKEPAPADIQSTREKLKSVLEARDKAIDAWHAKIREKAGSAEEVKARNDAGEVLKGKAQDLANEAGRLQNVLFDADWKAETQKFRGQPTQKPSPPAITTKVLKAQRENLLEQVDEALKAAPEESAEKIKISVPGDGEFTIFNTQHALKKFRDHAAKEFPATVGTVNAPGVKSGNASTIPKVADPEPKELPKIVGKFVSDEPDRKAITSSYADGTQLVATNGRQLIRVWTDKAPGTPVKPVRFDENGKAVEGEGRYPNYLQIRGTPELLRGGVKTDELYKVAAQAKFFAKEEKSGTKPVTIFVNKDGSIGARQILTAGDTYEHNVQDGALRLGAFNPDYLVDAMDAARRLGNEKVDVYGHGEGGGAVGFVGKNHESLLMPMRLSDETIFRDTDAQFNAIAGKKVHPSPVTGLGPIQDPEAYISRSTGMSKFLVISENGKLKLKKFPKDSDGPAYDIGTDFSIDKFGKNADSQNKAIKQMLGDHPHSSGLISEIRAAATDVLKERADAIKEVERRQASQSKAKGASVNISPGEGPKAGITPNPGLTGAIGDLMQAAGEIGGQIGGGGAQAALLPSTQFGNGTLGIGNIWRNAPAKLKSLWGGFAMHELPDITRSDRATGEAGVRYAASPLVARTKGTMFAGKVLEGLAPEMDLKLGVALTEDNLRSIRKGYENEAQQALADGNILKAQKAKESADNVSTLIGQKNSPFKTEKEYQAFLKSPEAQSAITRHNALWEAEKDPLYRQANDLDPDLELETRGEQTGARVNLKHVMPGEATKTTVGRLAKSPLIKQTATLLRRDPFATRAKGSGSSYEGSYTELMAHGFEREYPVAMQHEFIRSLIEAGDATLTVREYPKGLEIKGEPTKAYLMKLKPFEGRFLQVRKSLAPEYQAVTGLDPALRLPIYSKVADFLTRQSVQGIAEGSNHIANIFTQAFTGLGPTSNPLLNALIKVTGRPDVLWTLPKIAIKAFTDQRQRMLDLATIGATKEGFKGALGLGRLINRIDQGVRLVTDDVFKGMAKEGWVENTETERRHMVNQVGQYSKRLQPLIIRALRDTGINPFATATHTFMLQGVRELTLNPGVKAPTIAAAAALRAEKAAGWIGLIVAVGAINYLVSGNVMGPKGTKLLSVGWKDKDGKLQTFDVGKLTGYGRALDRTGIGPAVEAHRQGLSPNTQVRKGLEAAANTAVSYVAGPLVRFADVALTGSRPGVPQVQEAPLMPPRDDFAPLKSQTAANIKTALLQANPLIDASTSAAQGKETKDVIAKQLSRYVPKSGLNERTIAALPKIVKAGEMNDYVDGLAKQLRKLPREQRWMQAQKTLADSEMAPADRSRALQLLKRKRIFSFE